MIDCTGLVPSEKPHKPCCRVRKKHYIIKIFSTRMFISHDPLQASRGYTLTTFKNCLTSRFCLEVLHWMNTVDEFAEYVKRLKNCEGWRNITKAIKQCPQQTESSGDISMPRHTAGPHTTLSLRDENTAQNNCSHSITLISQIGVRRNR